MFKHSSQQQLLSNIFSMNVPLWLNYAGSETLALCVQPLVKARVFLCSRNCCPEPTAPATQQSLGLGWCSLAHSLWLHSRLIHGFLQQQFTFQVLPLNTASIAYSASSGKFSLDIKENSSWEGCPALAQLQW